MGIERLELSRSAMRVTGAVLGALAIGCLGLGVFAVAALLNPFAGGGMGIPVGFALICFVFAAVGLRLELAKGAVDVAVDELAINRAPLTTALRLPRAQVARVIVDDGTSAGEARFPTGDSAEPFLWPARSPRLRRQDAPRPNVALVLSTPLAVGNARHESVTFDVAAPLPFMKSRASVIFLAVEDPEAAARALGAWRVERPSSVPVLPGSLRAPHGQVPAGFMPVIISCMVVAVIASFTRDWWIMAVWLPLMIPAVSALQRRHRERAAAAMEAVGDDPAAAEAVRANWGSFGPPS
jgi:hypothetical protein